MTGLAADVLLADRYRVVELIGSGGMGSVWRAADHVLGRTVAVKVLRSEFASDGQLRRRFRAEGRAAASISHPHVVGVFDYGEQAGIGDECIAYLVMEFVEGRSLAAELAAVGTLPSERVTDIVEQTALGLSAAHARGLVHRDIKPANLLLTSSGSVKITDFGIARAVDAAPLTRTGALIGTAAYLSPEQAEGRGASPASDLYSLGVVAFACLTGAPPFRRESDVATLLAHVRDPVPPLPVGTAPALRSLVTDLLAKNPADRPASAEEVAARCRSAVLPVGDTAGLAAVWPAPAPAATEVLAPTDVYPNGAGRPTVSGPHRPKDRKRALLIGLAAAVALALAALLVALSGGSTSVKVPDVIGETVAAARATLTRAGLAVATRTVDAANHPAGDVIGETPTAGTTLGHGKAVQLTVTSGLVDVVPSQYIGQPIQTAQSQLAAQGLHTQQSLIASTARAGSVVSVSPSGQVAVGSTVTLGVAYTPPPVNPSGPGPGHGGGSGHGPGHGDGPGH